jgi:hypothetical protein
MGSIDSMNAEPADRMSDIKEINGIDISNDPCHVEDMAPVVSQLSRARANIIFALLCTLTLVEALDATCVAVILPVRSHILKSEGITDACRSQSPLT